MRAQVAAQVLFVYFSLLHTKCAFGQTEPTTFSITPKVAAGAHQGYPVSITVQKCQPNGTVDTSAPQTVVALTTKIQTTAPTIIFQDHFEGNTSQWTPTGSYPELVIVSTTHASITGNHSVELGLGANSQYTGSYHDLGSNLQPVRVSFYMRSQDTSSMTGPFVLLAMEQNSSLLCVLNTMIYPSSTAPAIRFRYGEMTVSTEPFPSGYSQGYYPVQSQQWYKVDIPINWANHSASLWVNDQFIENCPLGYTASVTTGIQRIYLYNYNTASITWIDEFVMYGSEGVTSPLPMYPSTITLISGSWQGTITFLGGGSNTFVEAYYTSVDGSINQTGISNLFSIIPACSPGQTVASYTSPCINCSAGYYTNSTNAATCTECSPGYYQPEQGQGSCIPCPANSFNPYSGSNSSSACLYCPYSSPAGSSVCTQCEAGQYYTASDGCLDCPKGTYEQMGACVGCAAGTYNNQVKQTSCQSCPPGMAQMQPNQTACSTCTAGYYSTGGASSCTPCEAGTYGESANMSTCQSCPAGTANNATHQTSLSQCVPCPLGFYAGSNGSSNCISCDPGTFANTTGLSSCYRCAIGFAQNASAASDCNICTPGFHSPSEGQAVCAPCDPGQVASGFGADHCDLCREGYTSLSGVANCTECPVGTYSNSSGSPACNACPAAYSSPAGSTFCTLKCGNGVLDTGEQCDDGNRNNGDGCSSNCTIESGYYCPQVDEPCQLSPVTHNANNGSNKSDTIIAAVVSVVGVVVIVAVAFLLWMRNRRMIPASRQQAVADIEMVPPQQHGSVVMKDLRYIDTEMKIMEKLGGGNFGFVYKGIWQGSTFVALKKFIDQQQSQQFLTEAAMLQSLSHPNVVQYFGVYLHKPENELYIVMEYLSEGALNSVLQEEHDNLQIFDLLDMARQAAAGMQYLEAKKIIHRDLALRNLLVTVGNSGGNQNSKKYIVKIGDFGLSRVAQDYYTAKETAMPVRWCSPEVIEYGKYSFKSDVWAFGVVLWELFSYGKRPYTELATNQEVIEKVLAGHRLKIPSICPDGVSQVIQRCWQLPNDRPTFSQIYDSIELICKELGMQNRISQLQTPTRHDNGVHSDYHTYNYNNNGYPTHNNNDNDYHT